MIKAVYILILTSLLCCKEKNSVQSNYEVNKNLNDFENLEKVSQQEHSLISIRSDFKDNRSRLKLEGYLKNGEMQKVDKAFSTGVSLPCECIIRNDSIIVTSSLGFWGGLGLKISLGRTNYHSSYLEYADDSKPFKMSPSDSVYTESIEVENIDQSLVFYNQPIFSQAEVIKGKLKFKTKEYYQIINQNQLDTMLVSGEWIFKCQTVKEE